ncbi:hypothetical protein T492DRAFT_468543 [Pavlovales sp. CCMP2436]|nr:hypothetical protein T492DRAFT_468543 [Pavlovales sp. CCMP2436]|mmetsp:Transcript_36667/g.91400  ORF Transcript_36667/g.91400 Transcript_36667/m.91400 type:complete len:203 (+) Transcript_36667:356-964(+)|eukprot:CAMPEP_0179887166 /NCGR_PEP_ID=MMETSP0982-20121206/31271_1 /TAXON_ID=483367 /ORGANISM="non described non described, Strain CCMP 2436" /LENGTH=202 /DNA_ID=CAMNT_0021782999 /DNA_START=820 /DNA_END=1428 /DNA_ORIENTATION=-
MRKSCGYSGAFGGTKLCSRCNRAEYCSKECFAKHWPRHKPNRRKINDTQAWAAGNVAVVSLDALRARVGRPVAMPADPTDPAFERALAEHMHASLSIPSARDIGARAAIAREVVFKLQIPQQSPGVPAQYGSTVVPLRCYDRSRSVDVSLTEGSCSNFEKMWNFVRDDGVVDGLKIYATGIFSEDGRTITINLVEPAAVAPW